MAYINRSDVCYDVYFMVDCRNNRFNIYSIMPTSRPQNADRRDMLCCGLKRGFVDWLGHPTDEQINNMLVHCCFANMMMGPLLMCNG